MRAIILVLDSVGIEQTIDAAVHGDIGSDPGGYAACLEDTDTLMEPLLGRLDSKGLLVVTAYHGNDPTFSGTYHTRELVPLLVSHGRCRGKPLGIRLDFFDVAQSVASFFDIPLIPRAVVFSLLSSRSAYIHER